MAGVFLTAEWQDLLFANYPVDPALLRPMLPYKTELDFFDGTCYCSMVGFLFANTRLLGVPVPFHQTFEEVNLRFYVRYNDGGNWKRGVVFVKEIVPRHMITLVANTLYGEHYTTHAMCHRRLVGKQGIDLEYAWKVKGVWNYLKAETALDTTPIAPGSEAEFITEHYLGYTRKRENLSGEYGVAHPRWDIYPVNSYDCLIDAQTLYGAAFREVLQQQPSSVFVAKGSKVKVMQGKVIR